MKIVTATATLRGEAPYSQARFGDLDFPKEKGETSDDHEKRTWRRRLHVNADGFVYIPANSFKNCLSDTAKFIGMKVPGGGKATYTKHFEAGIMMPGEVGLVLPVKRDDVMGEWRHVPSDGRRGGTKRVLKCFPVIHEWQGDVEFLVVDPAITEEVFREHIEQAGKYIGLGRFRPRNNGFYGRFSLQKLKWNAAA